MSKKIAAVMLPATALPFTDLHAHSVATGAPVTGYLWTMIGIATIYCLYLVARMRRRSLGNDQH